MSFAGNLSNKCRKQLLDTRLDAIKTASKKVVHRARQLLNKFITSIIKMEHYKISKLQTIYLCQNFWQKIAWK